MAAALVGLELATGTFYLLMLALGMVGGALAAHLGAGFSLQLVVAGVLGSAAVVLWYLKRRQEPKAPGAAMDKNVNMDIGETVQVTQWEAEGKANVSYRGAIWRVELAEGAAAAPGSHTIVEVRGHHLIVKPL